MQADPDRSDQTTLRNDATVAGEQGWRDTAIAPSTNPSSRVTAPTIGRGRAFSAASSSLRGERSAYPLTITTAGRRATGHRQAAEGAPGRES